MAVGAVAIAADAEAVFAGDLHQIGGFPSRRAISLFSIPVLRIVAAQYGKNPKQYHLAHPPVDGGSNMALSTSEFIDVINDLIETCKDGEKGFREAAEALQNSSITTLFLEFAQQRAQYASELQARVAKLGETPETAGSAAGAMHRGWINLKSAISGKNDKAIIDEAETPGEDIAVQAWQKGAHQRHSVRSEVGHRDAISGNSGRAQSRKRAQARNLGLSPPHVSD